MPLSFKEAANEELKCIIIKCQISSENDAASIRGSTVAMKRGLDVKYSQQPKVSVAKYALKHGVQQLYITIVSSSQG